MTAATPAGAPFTVMLDLDGTLVDPAAGILASYRHALAEMGHDGDPEADLAWIIGPPLRVSFARLLGPDADIEAAVRHYRQRYAEGGGIFDATPYPGIAGALAGLAGAGFRLLVCTAKAHIYARRIVEHFGLADHLSAVYGAELDGRHDDKGDLIAHIMDVEGLSPARLCMVGDRDNDMRAAARHGIPGIGVRWGYGSDTELTEAGAATLIDNPGQLVEACSSFVDARLPVQQ